MRIFICSRMRGPKDRRLRDTVRQAIIDLGHQPVGFEDVNPHPLPEGKGPGSELLEMVRNSNLALVIVSEEVTAAMAAEVEEARRSLGDEDVFYFFEAGVKKAISAEELRKHASRGYVYADFQTAEHLRRWVLRTFGALAEGGVKRLAGRTNRDVSGQVTLGPGQSWETKIDVPRGGALSINLHSRSFIRVKSWPENGSYQRHVPHVLFDDEPTRCYSRTRLSVQAGIWTVRVFRDDLPLPRAVIQVDITAIYSPLAHEEPATPNLMHVVPLKDHLPLLVGGQPMMLFQHPCDWGQLDPEVKAYFAKEIVVYLRALNHNRAPVPYASHDEVERVVRFYDLISSKTYSGREGYPGAEETALLGVARVHGFLPGINLASFDTRRWIGIGGGLPRIIDSQGHPASLRRGRPKQVT